MLKKVKQAPKLKVFVVITIFITLSAGIYAVTGFRASHPATPASPTNESTTNLDIPQDIPLDVDKSRAAVITSWRLQIPSLKVDAAVQEVGLTPKGNMAVPNNFTDTGWVKSGPVPGSPGTAVLAGHLNGGRDKSAVFSDLNKLKVGDYVVITDPKSPAKRFRVTGSEEYDIKDAPLRKIFDQTTSSHLNLITCSGSWDQKSRDYNKRRVVFTELAS